MGRHFIRLLATLVLAGLASGSAAAEERRIAPLTSPGFPPVQVDGHLGEWQERTVSFELAGEGDHHREARVWLGSWLRGLVIAGRVEAAAARFQGSAETLRAGEHVMVKLALVDDIALPLVGFGNQHGEQAYASENDCPEERNRRFPTGGDSFEEHCRSWVEGQRQHRERLRKLFVRRWLLAPGAAPNDPGLAVEDVSGPAYAGLDLAAQRDFTLLRASGVPRMAVRAGPGDAPGYGFEIEIPWEAMPPTGALRLEQLYVAVEVHRGHAAEEPGNLALPAAAPGAWTRFRLDAPREHHLGACHSPLSGLDPYDRWQPAWFVPGRELRVDRTFILGNEVRGYHDVPSGRSPVVHETRFFDVALEGGSHVCGPGLSLYRDGERVAVGAGAGSPGAAAMGRWIPRELEARREGSQILVKLGPRTTSASRFGTGQCGACPRVSLELLSLDPAGQVAGHFHYANVVDFSQLADVDLHVSEDWRTIESYELRREGRPGEHLWQRNRHCRPAGAAAFELCGKDEPAAPAKRVMTPIEE